MRYKRSLFTTGSGSSGGGSTVTGTKTTTKATTTVWDSYCQVKYIFIGLASLLLIFLFFMNLILYPYLLKQNNNNNNNNNNNIDNIDNIDDDDDNNILNDDMINYNDGDNNNNNNILSSSSSSSYSFNSLYPSSINKINISMDDSIHMYHDMCRKWNGFEAIDYFHMKKIIQSYAKYHTNIIRYDSDLKHSNQPLKGKYLILHPAAQMGNRMRAHMGAIYFGIVTKRVVLIDITADRYAARLDGVFSNPGFIWEYHNIPTSLKKKLEGSASSSRYTFPYEMTAGYEQIVCKNWLDEKSSVLQLNSHAAFLPLIARNLPLHNAVKNMHKSEQEYGGGEETEGEERGGEERGGEEGEGEGEGEEEREARKREEERERERRGGEIEEPFDLWMVEWFPVVASSSFNIYDDNNNREFPIGGQEQFEILEVLLARVLYVLEPELQQRVDALLASTYTKAREFYAHANIPIAKDEMPWVIGLHMRSEYLLSMNLDKSRKGGLWALDKEYKWFTDCGNLIVPEKYRNKPYFIFFAADTAEAQQFAEKVFGKERIYYQPFLRKGSTLEGIKDAIVDLITLSSFDGFIATPHSSYSEMSSLLGQPRRILKSNNNNNNNNNNDNSNTKTSNPFIFLHNIKKEQDWYSMAVNRPILPMMTHTEWEINKYNGYMYGRAIDIDLAHPDKKYIPLTSQLKNQINYKQQNICKLQVSASMGWIEMFTAFQRVHCYNAPYHHPGSWFPLIEHKKN